MIAKHKFLFLLILPYPMHDPLKVDVKKEFQHNANRFDNDFNEVKGQENVKRDLEIAAAGFHNLIMTGPLGAGKTMLAKRLPTILI